VGNITVGGTGKTPHIEYLITLLKDDNKIATLSRGYKRKSRGFILADDTATAQSIGDEPMQIKRKYSNILVAVDAKRVNGVKKLLSSPKGADLDAILLDDAYQHRHIKPGLSILLIDYNRPLSKDHMLPYGRLRESAHEKSRANIIIVSKSPENISPIERRIMVKDLNLLPYQKLYFTTLHYNHLQPLYPSTAINIVNEEWGKENFSILLVTGIANPKPLQEYLENFSNNIEEIIYPDHYAFTLKDVNQIRERFKNLKGNNKIIITTEKDSVRFHSLKIEDELLRSHLFYVPLRIRFLDNDRDLFNDHILNYVKKNRRSSNLHRKE
jgi:tetraacyldisaccharide 4'-kinase